MTKFFVAVLILALAYFVFLKRAEPPKEIIISEEIPDKEGLSLSPQADPSQALDRIKKETTIQFVSATSVTENPLPLSTTEEQSASETLTETDEPRENVDQTVIGNEKRLAASSSSAEVFDLLQKLRIRIKKLGETSTEATAKNFAPFIGSFEGSVVNRRQESVYGLKLEIKSVANGIAGKFQIDKVKDGKVSGQFNTDSGVQLVGRDGLVINSDDEKNYFQLYKLDNGYIAGTYYERRTRSFRNYKFILKNR